MLGAFGQIVDPLLGALLAAGDCLGKCLSLPVVSSTEAGEEIAILVQQPRDDVVEALVVTLAPAETLFDLLGDADVLVSGFSHRINVGVNHVSLLGRGDRCCLFGL